MFFLGSYQLLLAISVEEWVTIREVVNENGMLTVPKGGNTKKVKGGNASEVGNNKKTKGGNNKKTKTNASEVGSSSQAPQPTQPSQQ